MTIASLFRLREGVSQGGMEERGRSFTSSPGLHAELGRGALGSTRRGDIPLLGGVVSPHC